MTHSWNKPFSHIYLESAAAAYPLAQKVLQKFSTSTIVPINSYQEIFNRPRQEWREQKESPKLILAVKKGKFLYGGGAATPTYEEKNFFYTTPIANCLYDCSYCFLQGMYRSANILVFVNSQDYFSATQKHIAENGPLYLSLSYDSDLLGFEGMIPYTREWLNFARTQAGLTVEIRTKSGNFNAIENCEPTPNAILAWTLSPQNIIDRYEAKTASLLSRLDSARRAIECGWRVRICIDPILRIESWENSYQSLIEKMCQTVEISNLTDITLGTFRISAQQFKGLAQQNPGFDLMYKNYTPGSILVGSSPEEAELLEGTLESIIRAHCKKVPIVRASRHTALFTSLKSGGSAVAKDATPLPIA